MITLTREEAQQVLDALEKHILEYETIEALRARLAQPEREWECPKLKDDAEEKFIKDWNEGKVKRVSDGKRMVPEREWQGLTEGETIKLALDAFQLPEFSLEARLKMQNELVKAMNEPDSRLMIFAATIEQALKEKNSA